MILSSAMQKKILFLTQWFDPEPAFKGLHFVKELQKKGYEVEVVTGFPNYPNGKVYKGYKLSLFKREIIDNVVINRVYLYPSHNSNPLGRVTNYISFCVSSLIYGLLFVKKPNIIFAFHPPLTVGVTASIIGKLRKIPVIYDIQDLWPDTLKSTGMLNNDFILKIVGIVSIWVYKQTTKIVVPSTGFIRKLSQRNTPKKKIHLLENWFPGEKNVKRLSEYMQRDSDNLVLLFAGNMGKAQSLKTILNVAKHAQKDKLNVIFKFIGGGVEVQNLKEIAKEYKLTNVQFLPRVPMDEVINYLASSDILLIHLKDDPLFKITIPAKTQVSMCVGKPILMAVGGEANRLIEKAKCGVLAEPDNSESIYSGLKTLASLSDKERFEMGKKGQEYYFNNLSFQCGINKLSKIIEEIL